jgi:cytochrome b
MSAPAPAPSAAHLRTTGRSRRTHCAATQTSLRRREPDTEVGHNAAGGWMVLGLLALLLAQVATGLFAN